MFANRCLLRAALTAVLLLGCLGTPYANAQQNGPKLPGNSPPPIQFPNPGLLPGVLQPAQQKAILIKQLSLVRWQMTLVERWYRDAYGNAHKVVSQYPPNQRYAAMQAYLQMIAQQRLDMLMPLQAQETTLLNQIQGFNMQG